MLFNSYTFMVFLPLVFLAYWQIRKLRSQNFLLVVASYIFYGWWDWRFLSLLFISSVADFILGARMADSSNPSTRRWLLIFSLSINLGILGFFKYFNFFIDSTAVLLQTIGLQAHLPTLRIILPVGISFYTFQTLSYTIDIYRRQLEPTRNFIAFLAFVSFFPQLVAGPIERAKQLLPQFLKPREFNVVDVTDGLRQMLWGVFKKVLIADQCAIIVDHCFDSPIALNWWSYIVGVIFFAFQIYGDFSGYSDIAIGLARLFGFRLMRNFAYPYFSRDMAEFWRRWHISLSTWFRDYVYIPLGGSYAGTWSRIRNIIVTFTISGLWHGASWNFVFWGFLNGVYYIPLMLAQKHKRGTEIVAQHTLLPSLAESGQILLTFMLTCVAWVFFRAKDMHGALQYFGNMLPWNSTGTTIIRGNALTLLVCSVSLLVMFFFEWSQRREQHGLSRLPRQAIYRWIIYAAIGLAVINFWGSPKAFIYFQF